MNKTKMICLDMDDTLNLFYNYPDWLSLLRAEDPTPYAEAEAKWNMKRLAAVLRMLQGAGWGNYYYYLAFQRQLRSL